MRPERPVRPVRQQQRETAVFVPVGESAIWYLWFGRTIRFKRPRAKCAGGVLTLISPLRSFARRISDGSFVSALLRGRTLVSGGEAGLLGRQTAVDQVASASSCAGGRAMLITCSCARSRDLRGAA